MGYTLPVPAPALCTNVDSWIRLSWSKTWRCSLESLLCQIYGHFVLHRKWRDASYQSPCNWPKVAFFLHWICQMPFDMDLKDLSFYLQLNSSQAADTVHEVWLGREADRFLSSDFPLFLQDITLHTTPILSFSHIHSFHAIGQENLCLNGWVLVECLPTHAMCI